MFNRREDEYFSMGSLRMFLVIERKRLSGELLQLKVGPCKCNIEVHNLYQEKVSLAQALTVTSLADNLLKAVQLTLSPIEMRRKVTVSF